MYLCRAISRNEWSGILLYKVNGSITDPKNVEFHVKDIIPMHEGSPGYTEYTFNEDGDDKMMEYYSEVPEAIEEDWKVGHVHSHNTMAVFFSSTDMGELHDNSASHDFYLSLIVNNYMDMTAKVAIQGSTKWTGTGGFKALDENGEEYVIETQNYSWTKDKLYIYNCNIIREIDEITVDDRFAKSVTDIRAKAKQRLAKHNAYITKQNKKNKVKTKNHHPYSQPIYGGRPDRYLPAYSPVQTNMFEEVQIEAEEEMDNFLIDLLSGLNESSQSYGLYEVTDILDEIDLCEISAQEITTICITNFFKLYDSYFDMTDSLATAAKARKIIARLATYKKQYDFLPTVISGLNSLIMNYVKE